MASLYNSRIASLIIALQKRFKIENFIETGTYLGLSAEWASKFFKIVHSIEASEHYFQNAQIRLKNSKNIYLHYGRSQEVLPKIITKVEGAILFWLDAHWSAGDTFKDQIECPLLDEIHQINSLNNNNNFIFIDDAHMFLSPPPLPHNPKDWPTIDKVIFGIQAPNKNFFISVYHDVIVAVPQFARKMIEWYARDLSVTDLLKSIDTDIFNCELNTLYMIGAHKFQEYELILEKFPNLKHIFLFEPLPELQDYLKKFEQNDTRIKVFPYAISNEDGYKKFYVTNNEMLSSSLLPMGTHKEYFPNVTVTHQIVVPVKKIETVISENSLPLPDILYIDAQGSEYNILSSTPKPILNNIKIIYTESSTDEVYQGSYHLNEIIQLLSPNFDLIDFIPLSKNSPTHGDALFYNRKYTLRIPTIITTETNTNAELKTQNEFSKNCKENLEKTKSNYTTYSQDFKISNNNPDNISNIDYFFTQLRKNPKNIDVLIQLAEVEINNRNFYKAKQILESIFLIDQNNIAAIKLFEQIK